MVAVGKKVLLKFLQNRKFYNPFTNYDISCFADGSGKGGWGKIGDEMNFDKVPLKEKGSLQHTAHIPFGYL